MNDKATPYYKSLKFILILILIAFQKVGIGQVENSYYLPEISYDSKIPTPESILKYQIGEWHITHDQLVSTVEKLCATSEKCQFKEFGRTHENRALVNLVISSKKNLSNLDDIVSKHSQLTDPTKDQTIDKNLPIIIYQGYSVHGNESSGANAVPLIVYYLLAGQSDHLEELLDNAIIVVDPAYNPDGIQRFSTWANSHKHLNLVSDPISREFNEIWPGGRTNHYWFDLNRDWIFNIHPSSKARIENFHYWKPDILTDHHEMGSNSTFFFQPGIPSRTNPNTPQINQDLTEEIGTYHAASLDSIGSLYYSKESYDDYYYGKGSTYPDINGSIGILFEQASTRGHLRETSNGLMSFPFTIRNQFVTALSTQKAALKMRTKLLKFKKDYYKERYNEAGNGYYIFEESDYFKAAFFLDILNRHQIDVYKSNEDLNVSSQKFAKDISYIVPKKQRQTTLVKTIFEKVNTFRDSLFYDVSAWTLPLAFDMKYAESKSSIALDSKNKVSEPTPNLNALSIDKKTYAIAVDWYNYNAGNFLYKLQTKGIKVKAVTQPTQFMSNGAFKKFSSGSLVIPLSNQNISRDELIDYIKDLSKKYHLNISNIDTGFSPDGKSLGSPRQNTLMQPKVAMIIGEGVNPYEAGASWYQMDQRLEMPVTMIDKRQISRADLSKYNMIILPDGDYSHESPEGEKIKKWVFQGGTLVVMRNGIKFAKNAGMLKAIVKKTEAENKKEASYTTLRNYRGAQVIGGAIFESEINLDHPLFYGYKDNILPVFKRGTQFYEVDKNLASPLTYTTKPLLSGYASKQNIEKAKDAAGIFCSKFKEGKVIALVDNPNFRGYWLGGSKLFDNILFFNSLISRGSMGE